MNKILISLIVAFVGQSVLAETLACTQRQSSFNCLVCNCFYETRGEPKVGKIAVAKTVLSRVASDEFPDSICAVVFQPSQFSWVSDSNTNTINVKKPEDILALKECKEASNIAMDEGANGLLYFYNPRKASPAWARRMTNCGRAGEHVFMVPRGTTCPRNLGGNTPANPQQRRSSTGGATR